uniref:Uncharacterized protein n=1 Tax=Magallana gigas TaxID=29159 RepID=A0A8W8MIQ6_MAGGI|nr:uncharacterized protein LOC117685498 [Crassostrea gigas]
MVHASNVGAESIRISENSRVFQIASFELDDGGKVHNYLNPSEKTVEETLQTPVKTHISVKGILRKSSDLIESPNSRRKELILESMEGTSKIVCKLWGNCALFDVPPQDSIITLTGMDVTSWRGEISLNSSVLTELKETDEDGTFEGEIEAVNFSENYSYVIVNSRTFKMPTKTAIQIFGGKKFKDSITIKGMSKGTTITHVEVCNPAKKQKKD